jgi:hypothetical protein
MARDVQWQDIVDKVKVGKSRKLVRDTVLVFYASFESNIIPGCKFNIKNIGSFKGSLRRIETEALIKRTNNTKDKFYRKWTKRRQRLWAKEKFDDNWID